MYQWNGYRVVGTVYDRLQVTEFSLRGKTNSQDDESANNIRERLEYETTNEVFCLSKITVAMSLTMIP